MAEEPQERKRKEKMAKGQRKEKKIYNKAKGLSKEKKKESTKCLSMPKA